MLNEDDVKKIAEALAPLIQPKEWLSREELMREFSIGKSHLHSLINAEVDPLPYSTFGDKKMMFHRKDINDFLNRRKRNIA